MQQSVSVLILYYRYTE